jgi:chitodextrinase
MSRRCDLSLQLRAGLLTLALVLALSPTPARSQGAPSDTVMLDWTAPGDDGTSGTASAYEMRFSTSLINDASWNSATVVSGLPGPQPSGTRQSVVVRGLTSATTYWFAIKTVDEAGNWSGLSNVLRLDWGFDTAAPAAPSGLSATVLSGGGVELNWSANSEPDLASYTLYRALGASGPYSPLAGPLVGTTTHVDGSIPSGTATVRYQVSARDDSGNESARSSAVSVTLEAGAVAEAGAWELTPGFPNPSGPGTAVRIPVTAPAAGGSARLEIVNTIGQRVRRIDPGVFPPGASEIQWDGRNDAGREVAPGAYTAWLIAGPTRIAIRVVRVP